MDGGGIFASSLVVLWKSISVDGVVEGIVAGVVLFCVGCVGSFSLRVGFLVGGEPVGGVSANAENRLLVDIVVLLLLAVCLCVLVLCLREVHLRVSGIFWVMSSTKGLPGCEPCRGNCVIL